MINIRISKLSTPNNPIEVREFAYEDSEAELAAGDEDDSPEVRWIAEDAGVLAVLDPDKDDSTSGLEVTAEPRNGLCYNVTRSEIRKDSDGSTYAFGDPEVTYYSPVRRFCFNYTLGNWDDSNGWSDCYGADSSEWFYAQTDNEASDEGLAFDNISETHVEVEDPEDADTRCTCWVTREDDDNKTIYKVRKYFRKNSAFQDGRIELWENNAGRLRITDGFWYVVLGTQFDNIPEDGLFSQDAEEFAGWAYPPSNHDGGYWDGPLVCDYSPSDGEQLIATYKDCVTNIHMDEAKHIPICGSAGQHYLGITEED